MEENTIIKCGNLWFSSDSKLQSVLNISNLSGLHHDKSMALCVVLVRLCSHLFLSAPCFCQFHLGSIVCSKLCTINGSFFSTSAVTYILCIERRNLRQSDKQQHAVVEEREDHCDTRCLGYRVRC